MAPLLARRPAADRSFERIYRRHVGDVYRYTLAVLRDPHDAEDVTQTTFMNAYRAFQNGERPQTPKNWLIAIAHNVCRQRFRQAQRRPQEAPLFEDAAEMAVEEPEQDYTAEDIQRALGHLAFNQRAALVMRELEGRSYAEIAEIMGLTVGAVETLIFRGRRALREQLEGTLSCAEAELALSKQADGMLARADRGQLRAHLRECKECAALARRQRATRTALKALGAIPLPSSLLGMFGGGSAVGLGLAAKAAMVLAAGVVVGGAGYEGSRHVDLGHPKQAAASKLPVKSAPEAKTVTLPKRTSDAHIGPRPPVKADAPAAKTKAKEKAKEKAKAKAKPTNVANGPRPTQGPAIGAAAAHPAKVHGEPTNPVKRPKREPMNPVKKRPVHANHKPTVAHEPKPKHEHPAKPVTPATTPKPEKKEKKPAPPAPAVIVPANTDTPDAPIPTVTTPTTPQSGRTDFPSGPGGPKK
ncbi:MAG TPA: sigma-70 family RNA polymerase sigma factor [Gaiellaceae bacterium]|jgi:RNA polymerase sigma factor (sigma-70 family)